MPEPIPSAIETLCIWRFAGVRFDERTLEVERADGSVEALERKPNDVLRHLLRHAGEVVTKNELLDQIWPGRYVTEGVLSKHVARLRRAIGDEAQQILRTVPGIGYRLVADVTRTAAPTSPELPPLELVVGQRLDQRPNWRLEQRLGRNRSIEVWRLCNVDTGEQRVFKLCTDEADLISLKREITVSRLLGEDLDGHEPGHVPIIDWNLEHSPYWIELPWLADGSLLDWWRTRSGQWSLAERVELAADIAQALAGAHELGVLHKDLKPANVLIDRDGSGRVLPKLADFGSARLLDPARLPELGITQLGFSQTVSGWSDTGGTPLYLAPEVIRGAPFTLASDLFAFGTILYQLVIDDPRQPLAAGWERGIDDELLCEEIAALIEGDPSHRITDAGAVAQRLRSLEARRSERAAQRHLATAAEQARLDAERARRRRNLASAFATLLLIALLVSGFALWQTRLARDELALRVDTQNAMFDLLRDDLFGRANPHISDGSNPDLRSLLEPLRLRLRNDTRLHPEVSARLLAATGSALLGLGELGLASADAEHAMALASAHLSDGHLAYLEAGRLLASIDSERGALEQARARLDALLDSALAHGQTDPRLLHDLYNWRTWTEFLAGNHDRVVERSCAEPESLQALPPAPDAAMADRHQHCALAMCRLDRCTEAQAPILASQSLIERQHGPESFAMAQLLFARHLAEAGSQDYPDALDTLDQIAAIFDRLGLQRHPLRALYHHERAFVLFHLQRHDEAVDDATNAVAQRIDLFGEHHVHVAFSRNLLARNLEALGQSQRAWQEARLARALLDDDDIRQQPDLARLAASLDQTLVRLGGSRP